MAKHILLCICLLLAHPAWTSGGVTCNDWLSHLQGQGSISQDSNVRDVRLWTSNSGSILGACRDQTNISKAPACSPSVCAGFPTILDRLSLLNISPDAFTPMYRVYHQSCSFRDYTDTTYYSGSCSHCNVDFLGIWSGNFCSSRPDDWYDTSIVDFVGNASSMQKGYGLQHYCLQVFPPLSTMWHNDNNGDTVHNNSPTNSKVCAYLCAPISGGQMPGNFTWRLSLIGCVDPLPMPRPPIYNKTLLPNLLVPIVDTASNMTSYIQYGSRFDFPVIRMTIDYLASDNSIETASMLLGYSFPFPSVNDALTNHLAITSASVAPLPANIKTCNTFASANSSINQLSEANETFCAVVSPSNPGQVCACKQEDCPSGLYQGCVPRPTLKDSGYSMVVFYDYDRDNAGNHTVSPSRVPIANIMLIQNKTDGSNQPALCDSSGNPVTRNAVDYRDYSGTTAILSGVAPCAGSNVLAFSSDGINNYTSLRLHEYITHYYNPSPSSPTNLFLPDNHAKDSAIGALGLNFYAIIPADDGQGNVLKTTLEVPTSTYTGGCDLYYNTNSAANIYKCIPNINAGAQATASTYPSMSKPFFVPGGSRWRVGCKGKSSINRASLQQCSLQTCYGSINSNCCVGVISNDIYCGCYINGSAVSSTTLPHDLLAEAIACPGTYAPSCINSLTTNGIYQPQCKELSYISSTGTTPTGSIQANIICAYSDGGWDFTGISQSSSSSSPTPLPYLSASNSLPTYFCAHIPQYCPAVNSTVKGIGPSTSITASPGNPSINWPLLESGRTMNDASIVSCPSNYYASSGAAPVAVCTDGILNVISSCNGGCSRAVYGYALFEGSAPNTTAYGTCLNDPTNLNSGASGTLYYNGAVVTNAPPALPIGSSMGNYYTDLGILDVTNTTSSLFKNVYTNPINANGSIITITMNCISDGQGGANWDPSGPNASCQQSCRASSFDNSCISDGCWRVDIGASVSGSGNMQEHINGNINNLRSSVNSTNTFGSYPVTVVCPYNFADSGRHRQNYRRLYCANGQWTNGKEGYTPEVGGIECDSAGNCSSGGWLCPADVCPRINWPQYPYNNNLIFPRICQH